MNQKITLGSILCLFLSGNSQKANCQSKRTMNDDKPNIIFILTDDQRWDALGYAGNKIIRTPEMDKLAQSGAWFRNAIATTPICAASRASILSGLYQKRNSFP